MEMLKYIIKYTHQIRFRVLLGIILLGVSIMFSLIHPMLMGKYIDSLSTGVDGRHIVISVLTLVVLWLVSTAISYLNAVNSAHMSIRLTYSINFHLLQHTERLPYAVLVKMDTTYLNTRIHNDSSVLAGFFLDSFLGAIAKVLTCLAVLGVILFKSPIVALLIIFLLPIHIGIYAIFRNIIEQNSKEMMENRDSFFGEMQKQLRHIRTIKINVWYKRLYTSLIKQFDRVYHSAIKYTQTNALYAVFTQITQIAANLIILLVCGFAVGSGSMNLGSLVTISSLFATLFSSFTSLMDFGKSYANAHAAFVRVEELENAEEEQNGELNLDTITAIQISNLTFHYPDDERILMDHISIDFVPGKMYQIKGENGCGKSTFLNLLFGLYETSGEVCFNGIPINSLNMLSIRQKLISIVEQEPPLVFESISENIIDDDSDKCKLFEKIHEARLDLFVGNIDLITDRNFIDGTSNLSGGEKQKIAIVRALLKESKVLILDEPTSALDSQSCDQLKEVLSKFKDDRIIILIDHRSVFADIVDESYNINTGTVSAISLLPKAN